MPSLDDLANLLAIGAQNSNQQDNVDLGLGSLGLGGNDDGDNGGLLGITFPPILGGSTPTLTQTKAVETSQTSATQTSSSSSSSDKSSSSSSSSSSSATSTSSSSSSESNISSNSASVSATSSSASATDSASTDSATASSATDTASAAAITAQSSDASGPIATSTGTITASLTGVSDSAGPSATGKPEALGAVATSGFEAHKPLYIGIIVVASILGIIFFVVVGTWAIRRRRRNQIADFADELSSDNLVGGGSGFGGGSGASSLGHGSVDVEKGATGAGGWGVDVIEKMETVGGSRGAGAAFGVAGVGAGMARGPSQTQRNAPPAAYGQPDYAARNANAYGQVPYGQVPARAPMYQQQPMVGQMYAQQAPTYASPYGQTQPQQQQQYPSPTESLTYGSHLPNPFEGAESNVPASQPAPYDLAHTPVPVQQFSVGPARQAAAVQRKPPPPFLTLDTTMSPVPGPVSAGSLSGAPMQPAASVNSANPPIQTVESPQEIVAAASALPKTAPPRRSSLLDGPATPTSAQKHGKKASADKRDLATAGVLYPGHPPAAPPLPDAEFGSPTVVNGGSPVTADGPRMLKVVNA